MMGWEGRTIVPGAGYFADACLCRPKSRGRLVMGRDGIEIDLGLFSDTSDLETLVHGVRRLRALLGRADFGSRRGKEHFPGPGIASDDEIASFIRSRAGTAYHPVGTCRMGPDTDAPVTPRLGMRGTEGLWVADASVMPAVTSANTNAPAMMIGHRAGRMIAEDAG